jgi:hypothetical protein
VASFPRLPVEKPAAKLSPSLCPRLRGRARSAAVICAWELCTCLNYLSQVLLGDGNVNPVDTVKTLKEVGFNGFIIDDHMPYMVDAPGGVTGAALGAPATSRPSSMQ